MQKIKSFVPQNKTRQQVHSSIVLDNQIGSHDIRQGAIDTIHTQNYE